MKTAVDVLIEQLKKDFMFGNKYLIMFEQAKAMEKEQIIEAFHKQTQKFLDKEEAEQYYNETFKSE